ncbi:hypothetical protein, partial [Serratia marcescens]|uniref:hypothetical protein n=1 Tax=Serratia marcescens TaxID=615 RepID=UPI0019534F06
ISPSSIALAMGSGRAHKQEKFMVNSILGALYSIPVALVIGTMQSPHGGAWGIAACYALGLE